MNRNALSNRGASRLFQVTGGPGRQRTRRDIQLWDYAGATNQQWMPVPVGNAFYKFVGRNSSKSDVPDAFLRFSFPCNSTIAMGPQHSRIRYRKNEEQNNKPYLSDSARKLTEVAEHASIAS